MKEGCNQQDYVDAMCLTMVARSWQFSPCFNVPKKKKKVTNKNMNE